MEPSLNGHSSQKKSMRMRMRHCDAKERTTSRTGIISSKRNEIDNAVIDFAQRACDDNKRCTQLKQQTDCRGKDDFW